MSVGSAPFYWLVCDRCGVKSTETSEYGGWAEVEGAEEEAEELDWLLDWLLTDDGGHFCPDCTTWDEDADERVPLLTKPATT